MTLKITVTDAGRAALVNASNTGTLPVTVDKIGITATAFAPSAALTALPGQLKQLSTFGGAAVAADTIHTVLRDDSADTYSLMGFGLFLADGTLFGVFGQATAIMEKSSLAMLLLATDIIFADIDAASITFGDTNFLNPPATTSVQGVVELATDAEAITGTDQFRAVTPHALKSSLDDRLGVAAPTSFVKTLLNKATVLAFVTALGIRGAASFDTGANNGLDTDLLDGQHGAYYLDWANLANKPGTFAPSAHQHAAGDITSGTLLVECGGTGGGAFTAGSYVVGNGTGALAAKTPAQVLTDIGAAAVSHSHAISDINGLQLALDAKTTPAAVTAQINTAVNGLINGSPGALDTLKELADAMGDDANFAATMTNALAGKQPNLGFSPVQQGTGVGQGTNTIKLGWAAGGLKLTVDSSDQGYLAGQNWVAGIYATIASPSFTGPASFSRGETSSYGAGGAIRLTGSGGSIVWATPVANSGGEIALVQYGSTGVRKVGFSKANGTPGTIVFDVDAGGLTANGPVVASGGFQVSDRRFKNTITAREIDTSLAGKLAPNWSQWLRNNDNGFDTGLIAQDLQEHAPQFVKVPDDPADMLAIDKAGVALECALGADILIRRLAARIEALEARAA